MERTFIITNPMPTHNNSPAVSLGKFVQVVKSAGYSPKVIGARLPENIPGVPDGVPVKSFRYGGRSVVKMLSFLLLQVKSFFYFLANCRKGDAVYFWIADKMIGAFLGAKLRGAEVNFFLYGMIDNRHAQKWARSLEQYMTDHADRVCAEGANVFTECSIPEDKPLDVIRLFVPESDITPIPYSEREPVIAVMSRLSPEKHPEDTIRAVCRVHETHPEIRLRIIGGGPIEGRCRQLVHELCADDFITFTGWLPSHDAKRRLSECILLSYPSDFEGVPGGILEAMSFGVPALASPVGGIPDLIEDGVDGVLLTSPDADTIARELESLLTSGELERLSREAMRKIREYFSLEAAAANFKAVRANRKKGND